MLLVEQFGALGGLGTTGLVPMFAPTSDGERMIYGGIFREINLEMCSRMKVEPWRESWQAINPEILKRLLDEKIAQAGVRVLYCAKLCEAEMDGGRILAVVLPIGTLIGSGLVCFLAYKLHPALGFLVQLAEGDHFRGVFECILVGELFCVNLICIHGLLPPSFDGFILPAKKR